VKRKEKEKKETGRETEMLKIEERREIRERVR
jgi:hypothetical protein